MFGGAALTSQYMTTDDDRPTHVRFGRRKIPVPRSKLMRTVVGTSMVVVGALPGLPAVAAVPVGLMLLSVDYPGMRRRRRLLVVWSGRRWQRWNRRQNTSADDT